MSNPESNVADVTDAEAAPARADAQAMIDGGTVARMIMDFHRTFAGTYRADVMTSSLCAVGPLQSMIGLAIKNGHLAAPTSEEAKDRIAELEEWKRTIIGLCVALGSDAMAWGGDKTGWGFIHYFVKHLHTRAEAAEAQLCISSGAEDGIRALAQLRADGWSVAVHNDYRLAGVQMTFWLFAHSGGQWVKGEGRSDGEAIAAALEQITRRT